jgi:ribose transport system permease protein
MNEEVGIERKKLSRYITGIFRGSNTYISIILLAVILFIICSIVIPDFFTIRNLINLLRRSSIDIIIAVGMTIVLLTGEIDLSIPGIMGTVGMITALLLKDGIPVVLCVIIAFAIGIFFGFINGILSTKIPSFIATIGVLSITRGIALYVTNGATIATLPEQFLLVDRTTIVGIPIAAVYVLIIVIIFIIVTTYTSFGRQLYAIGGNRDAARSCGFSVNLRVIQTFIIMGALGTLAALTLVAKINAATPLLYENASLNAIAAVVIGGTSLFGGRGHIAGSVGGAFIIVMLSNIFTLVGFTLAVQQIILGIILITVILIDYFRTHYARL